MYHIVVAAILLATAFFEWWFLRRGDTKMGFLVAALAVAAIVLASAVRFT